MDSADPRQLTCHPEQLTQLEQLTQASSTSSESSIQAKQLLWEVEGETVADLCEPLPEPDVKSAERPRPASAVTALADQLQHPSAGVRKAAARSLGRLAEAALRRGATKVTLEHAGVLAEMNLDADPEVREVAFSALEQVRQAAEEHPSAGAINALLSEQLQQHAAMRFYRGPPLELARAESYTKAPAQMSVSGDESLRKDAGARSSYSQRLSQAMASSSSDSALLQRRSGAQKHMRPRQMSRQEAQRAKALEREETKADTRELLNILRKPLSPAKAREEAQRLAQQLEDPDAGVRTSAAMALGHMGQAAYPFVGILIRRLADKDSFVRAAAAVSVGKLPKPAPARGASRSPSRRSKGKSSRSAGRTVSGRQPKAPRQGTLSGGARGPNSLSRAASAKSAAPRSASAAVAAQAYLVAGEAGREAPPIRLGRALSATAAWLASNSSAWWQADMRVSGAARACVREQEMVWRASRPAAGQPHGPSQGALRTVIRCPLKDPVQDPLKAAARGVWAHRGPWARPKSQSSTSARPSPSSGSMSRGCCVQRTVQRTAQAWAPAYGGGAPRGIFGAANGPGMISPSLMSPGLAQEVAVARLLDMNHGAQTAARRLGDSQSLRSVFRICGLSVGAGAVAIAVSWLDWWQWADASEARQPAVRSPLATANTTELTRTASGPLMDLLARRLIRKNSRLAIGEVYTFPSGPPLGVGSFGVVYRAVHNRTGIERAVKRIDKQAVPDVAMLSREVEALRLMDHPNVCRLVEYFETDRYLWLVMDLCRGEELCGRLLQLPRGLPEPEAARLMVQMLCSILHCHQRSVLHRDIKPENFLFFGGSDQAYGVPRCRDDSLKLVDFGFSVLMAPSIAPSSAAQALLSGLPSGLMSSASAAQSAPAGTLLYRSPESFKGEVASQSDDIWSLGVIFHILLTGQFPFSTNDDDRFQELCDRGLLEKDVQEHLRVLPCSSAAADLACRLLSFDPADRITVEGALKHPFLGGVQDATEPLCAEEVYRRCTRFLRSCRLRRIAAAAIAQMLDESKEDRARVRDTFMLLDKRGVGQIAPADLHEFLASSGIRAPSSWLAGLCHNWPRLVQHQGIGYTAFSAATLDDACFSDALCRTVFDLLDADHDGSVSAKDLQQRLGLSLHECERIVTEATVTTAGTTGFTEAIVFPEFLQIIRSSGISAVRTSASERSMVRQAMATNGTAALAAA